MRSTTTHIPASAPLTLATDHLRRLGHSILDVAAKRGLVDVVSLRENLIVFTTVHRRPRATRLQQASDARRLAAHTAAARWLATHPLSRPPARGIRFDAITVTLDASGRLLRLDHVEGLY
jgi:Holliday junction resolvase-like predicted endonuclease